MAGIFITHFCPNYKHAYSRARCLCSSLGRVWANWVFAALAATQKSGIGTLFYWVRFLQTTVRGARAWDFRQRLWCGVRGVTERKGRMVLVSAGRTRHTDHPGYMGYTDHTERERP